MQPKIPFGPFVLAVCLAASPRLSAGGDSCPGFWRSLGPPGASGGIADVIGLPGGAMVVGLRTDGLRFYERGPMGTYAWRAVTTATPGSGLASNKVTSLALFHGELWIGTQDAGISILTPETNAWRTMTAGVTPLPSNVIHRITAVPPDPAIASPGPTDESLCVSTPAGAAVYRYFNGFPLHGWYWGILDQAHGLPESYVRDTAVQFVGGTRYTWIATYGYLVRWDGTSFESFGGSCDFTTAERIVVDGTDRVWLAGLKAVPALGGGGDGGGGATVYVPYGLCRGTTGRFGQVTWTSFPDQYGHDMSPDDSGRLWTCGIGQVGAGSGAWVHDQGSWCVFHAPELTSDQVNCVHATGELTWFGQNASARLETYSNNWSVIHSPIAGILDDPGPIAFGLDATFVGVYQGLAYQSNPQVGNWVFLKLSNVPSAAATAVLPVEDGVWVGMAPDGLRFVEINPVTRNIVGTTAYRAADGLAGDDVQALARDKAGRIWVGTSQGLSLQGNGYWLNFTTATSPLANDDVRALAVDALGKLWIGTAGGGINLLDPEALGGNTWESQTSADGLAADDIRALAMAPGGVVWAATPAGACERDPATGAWTVHAAAAGDLPGEDARSLAIDSAGRVWVGTTAGLAVRETGAWRHYHATNSGLDSDRVEHLAARGTELWAAAGDHVSVRRDIEGPIGQYPPVITSFSPTSAAPDEVVTVKGTGFDERGPAYNQIFVGGLEGSNGGAAQPCEIYWADADEITFRVRELAQDGKLRVISHCLAGTSAATLQIAPRISQVNPSCASVGDMISIHGAGFTAGGGAVVRFGNGPWRNPVLLGGELRPDRISLPLTQGDTEGEVSVMGSNGLIATHPLPLTLGHVELASRKVFQGVEGVPLIWGKRTVVSVRLSANGCSTKVTGGSFYWKKKDQTLQLGGRAYARDWGTAIALDITDPVSAADPAIGALELVGEFESARSGNNSFFPLADLASIVCVIRNNNVDVLSVEIPAAELKFQEVEKPLELYGIAVFPRTGGDTWQGFWDKATTNLENFARIMPQPDFAPMHGSAAWIGTMSSYFEVDSADLRSDLLWGDFMTIRSTAGDLIDPGFGQFGMALIDAALFVDHKEPDDPDFSGKAMIGPFYNGDTAVSYNSENKGAPTITQELCHMLGMVDGDAENHDDENDNHSVYDEGEALDAEKCAESPSLTFWEAVRDQLGINYPELYQITSGPPRRLDLGACSDNRARSCMSYAPRKFNRNGLLEPVDTRAVREYLTELHARWGGGGGGGALAAGTTLRLRGAIGMDDTALVTLSYLDDADQQPAASEAPDSHYHAVLRDALGAQLIDFPFHVEFHGHGDADGVTAFGVSIPFPEGTRSVELRHEDEVLWSASRSASPPVVSFTAPAGGSHAADATVQVSWTASDPDGDPLQFALDYSADDGATWIKLPQYVTATSLAWKPGFLPRSDAARLRIRASDGFNTATALSAPFRLTPAAPVVFIKAPEDGAQIPEGSLVDLVARSMTSEGFGQGSFLWQIDGQPLDGNRGENEHRFDVAGAHTIAVQLTDPSGLPASAQITVQVIPDFDRDGIPNDWEQAHGLNPLDFTDGSKDPDQDELSSYAEYERGTDPQNPDTDSDGAADGAEVLAGTDPLSPDSVPPAGPTLQLGIAEMGFTVHEGDAASEPRSFWLLNHGPGSLDWSISNGLPWLQVSPGSGRAPSQVTLVAVPGGLGVGSYSGQIAIEAPGAAGSPHTILVRLTVKPAAPHDHKHFIRGDSSSDGAMDISDAIFTLQYLFIDATMTPACKSAADANDDAKVDIADPIYSLAALFLGGPAPPPPYPACGTEATPDGLACAASPICP